MSYETLRADINNLVDAGDMQALEKYVIDHFTEFPEEVQGKLMVHFYSNALERVAGEAQMTELRKDLVEIMDMLGEMKEPIDEAK